MNKYNQALLSDKINEKFSDLSEKAGKDGYFQINLMILLTIVSFTCSLTITSVTIQKIPPSYLCIEDHKFNSQDYDYIKLDLSRYKIEKSPQCIRSFCNTNYDSNMILIFDHNSLFNINVQLELDCDENEYIINYTQSIFFGRMFGTIFFSYLSDKYGRDLSFNCMLYLMLISQFIYIIANNKLIILLNTFIYSSCSVIWDIACLIATESMSKELYSIANGIFGASFSFSGIFNLIIFYVFQDWRYILWVYILLSLYSVYLSKYYMTNTVKYLIDKKNYHKLITVLKKISATNHSSSEQIDFYLSLDQVYNEYNLKDIKKDNLDNEQTSAYKIILGPYILLFGSNKNYKNLLKTFFIYVTMSYIYYGQLLYVKELPGNPIFNTFLIFFGELISNIIAGLILKFTNNRRLILRIFFTIMGFICLLISFLKNELFVILGIFSTSLISAILFIVNIVYLNEILEVEVKSVSLSVMINLASFMIIFSPYIIRICNNSAYLNFTIFCLICIFNLNYLPDTHHLK